MIPIPELQFLGFGSQAFHQIEGQVARYRFRSQGSYPMPMVIRAPFGGNVRTPELHSDAHEAKYANAPGLKVVMPATARDAKGLLAEAIRDPDPVLFCEPLRGYRLIKDEVPEEDYTVPLGKARIVREGTDLVIVAYSAAVVIAERAAERAAEEGYSVGVLDLRSLVPLDVDALREAVAACGRAVVLHEGSLTAGFGAELVATIQEEAFWSLQAPIGRVAAPDTPYPPGTIEELYVPSVDRVLDAIRAAHGGLMAARVPPARRRRGHRDRRDHRLAGRRGRPRAASTRTSSRSRPTRPPSSSRARPTASSRGCAASPATRSTWARCWR